MSHPVVWERKPRAAVMVAGNGSAMVYARPDDRRSRRWSFERLRQPQAFGSDCDLLALLVAEPAVTLIAAESEHGGIAVASGDGEARVHEENGMIEYRPWAGDPLQMGGAWKGSSRDWLDQTWNGAFPDAAFQLLDQFRTRRTGDLLVVAREGYDFRDRFEVPEHRAGHGSLIRVHMQTPVWASEPVPSSALRTVDLFPAMLSWLGLPVPDGIDGERVWNPAHSVPERPSRRAVEIGA